MEQGSIVTRLPTLRCFMSLVGISWVAGCASARGRPPGVPVPIGTFSVTSLRSAYGIQGVLNGSLVRRDEWILVTIDSGAIRTQQADPAPVWGLRLRAGLAACTPDGNWEVASESRALRVAPLVGIISRDEILDASLRPLRAGARFDVAVPPGTRFDRSWLVIVFEWPFENEFATYSLEVNVPLDGTGRREGGARAAMSAPASMRLRCARPG